jgi:hypothetical protein
MRTVDQDEMLGAQWSDETIGRAVRLDQERGRAVEQLRLIMRQVIDQLAALGSSALEGDRVGLSRGAVELTALLDNSALDLPSLCERYAELRRIVVAESSRRPTPATEAVLPRPVSARRSELGAWHQLPRPPRRHTNPRSQTAG